MDESACTYLDPQSTQGLMCSVEEPVRQFARVSLPGLLPLLLFCRCQAQPLASPAVHQSPHQALLKTSCCRQRAQVRHTCPCRLGGSSGSAL